MFFLIAGPCVVENETMPFEIAEHIVKICGQAGDSISSSRLPTEKQTVRKPTHSAGSATKMQ